MSQETEQRSTGCHSEAKPKNLSLLVETLRPAQGDLLGGWFCGEGMFSSTYSNCFTPTRAMARSTGSVCRGEILTRRELMVDIAADFALLRLRRCRVHCGKSWQ